MEVPSEGNQVQLRASDASMGIDLLLVLEKDMSCKQKICRRIVTDHEKKTLHA